MLGLFVPMAAAVVAAGSLQPSLFGKPNEEKINMDDMRDQLAKESETQGLRNNDIAELTGWSTSKTSKIVGGKQPITMDDIRHWARSLGYTPDAFAGNNIDRRYYDVTKYIRSISDSLEGFFDSMDDDVSNAIMKYELPLAILACLGVKNSDYAVRASAATFNIGVNSKNSIGFSSSYVVFWHRALSIKDTEFPKLGFFLSPENEDFLFSIYVSGEHNKETLKEIRMKYKDFLQVDEEETTNFKDFARRTKDWIPDEVRYGEVLSFGSDTNGLPGPGEIEDLFVKLFREYCSLVWEAYNMDILPDKLKQRSELSPFEQYGILTGAADFSAETKEKVRTAATFKCENDENHKSFIDQSGRQFMEVVPIVPFSYGTQYGQAIMSEANAVCLCPNCQKQLYYGQLNDREDLVIKLYRKHQDDLQKAGIDVSLTNVLQANNLS